MDDQNTDPFVKAVRRPTPLFIGLAGQSGSGKTWSALELATGLAGPDGKIAFIDTEEGRALHYASNFTFSHASLSPPYTLPRYWQLIQAAQERGYNVVVIDSYSHSWEGEGGMLDQANTIAEEMAERASKGGNQRSADQFTFPAWRKPKETNNRFIQHVLKAGIHLIFCLRAKDKVAMRKNARGYNEPTPIGIRPICEDNFPYEMTLCPILEAEEPGVPKFTFKALAEPFHGMFRPNEKLNRRHGAALARWAAGGAVGDVRERPARAARPAQDTAPQREDFEPARQEEPAPPAEPKKARLLDASGSVIGAYLTTAEWMADYRKLAADPDQREAVARHNLPMLRWAARKSAQYEGDLAAAEAILPEDMPA